MAEQFTGSNAEILYKTEKKNGVLRTTPAAGGQTKLTEAVKAGASDIKVVSVAGIVAGDIIALGKDGSQEIMKVKTVVGAQKKITVSEKTPINFRHEKDEAALKVADVDTGWFLLGNVTSFTPSSDRPLDNSQALGSGVRAISNARPGRYEFGADITIEFDIESAPMWLLHALNANYTSTGTAVAPAVATTLGAAAAKEADSVTLASVANVAVGDFLEINGKEVVKIKTVTPGTKAVTFGPSAPLGLRNAHANAAVVKKVVAPFTHTIKKGKTLPAGLSLLLKLSAGDDQASLILLTGGRINTLTFSAEGTTTIPTWSVKIVAMRGQVLTEDIFGAPTKIIHTPYAQWEAEVTSSDAENRFNSLSLDIQNNISASTPLGSPLAGAVTPGEGAVTGSFEYEYRTQAFALATAKGEDQTLKFLWTYIGDDNHSLELSFPKARFGGAVHPGVESKDPIADSKDFTAILDSVTNTDIKVVAKTKNPSVEYLTEG